MNDKDKNIQTSREGWAEMIRQEVEDSGQSEPLMSDFFEDENKDWTW